MSTTLTQIKIKNLLLDYVHLNPGTPAKIIARDLSGKEGVSVSKKDINPILYRERSIFRSDGYTPPTSFEPDRITCRAKGAKRPICTNLCQSSFVAHLRPELPTEFGSVFWYTMATPAYGPYFPLYPFGSKIIASFTLDDPDEKNTSAWWIYRHLQQKVDISNAEIIKSIRNQTESVTSTFISEQELWENKVQKQILG